MRNRYIYFVLLLLLGFKSKAQGSDVIVWIDNSGSIDTTEYSQMSASIQSVITNVLQCNPANRVAVVQYGGITLTPRIWIESNFTNNATIANSFVRRTLAVGGADYAHESLGLIGNALDGIPNVSIVSPQTTLTQTPGNSLAIFLFTDAERAIVGSYLVNLASPAVGTNAAFTNYTAFKNVRNATFLVTAVPPDLAATNAAAAIASVGGSYMGTIESYPANPGGAGTLPRFFLSKTNFILTPLEIANTTQNICSVTQPPCPLTLNLISTTNDVTIGQDNRQAQTNITASNRISSGAVGIYHAGTSVVLTNGFHSANGSRFRGYIEGCTGNYVGKEMTGTDIKETEPSLVSGIRIYPNPSSHFVTVSSDSPITKISLTAIDGRAVYNKTIANELSHEIDAGTLVNGIYLLVTETADGKIHTGKFIKN